MTCRGLFCSIFLGLIFNVNAQVSEVKSINRRALSLIKKNPDSAFLLIEKAEELSLKMSYEWGYASALHLKAWLKSSQGDDSASLFWYGRAIEAYQESDSILLNNEAIIYRNIAAILNRNNLYSRAIDYYRMSQEKLSLYIRLYPEEAAKKNRTDALMENEYFMAMTHRKLGKFSEALTIFLKLRDELLEEDDYSFYARVLNQLGLVTRDMGNLSGARDYYDEMINNDSIPEKYKSTGLHNYANTYSKDRDYSKAETLLRKSIDIKIGLVDSKMENGVFLSRLDLGEALFYQGKYKMAVDQWENALGDFSNVSEDPDYFKVYNWLQRGYMLLDPSRSDYYGELFFEHMETFYEKRRAISEQLNAQLFELKLKDAELELELSKLKLKQERQNRLILIVSSVIFSSIVVYFILLLVRKLKHKQFQMRMRRIVRD